MDLDPLGERSTDAGDGRDLLDRRVPDALRAAEDPQQLALALGPDARQVIERRAHLALRPQLAVVADREPVRLVAQPLDQVESR